MAVKKRCMKRDLGTESDQRNFEHPQQWGVHSEDGQSGATKKHLTD